MTNELFSLEYLKSAARMLLKMLEGNTFDLISFHAKYHDSPRVVENLLLNSEDVCIDKETVRIPLHPRRSLAFCPAEKPSISVESVRQIKIVRHLPPSGDVLTQIVLIHKM